MNQEPKKKIRIDAEVMAKIHRILDRGKYAQVSMEDGELVVYEVTETEV